MRDLSAKDRIVLTVLVLIRLKKRWMDDQHQNANTRQIMRTIEKDVSRTDRQFGFYADSGDGHVNVKSLFHVLMTYCVSHPTVTYSQGTRNARRSCACKCVCLQG